MSHDMKICSKRIAEMMTVPLNDVVIAVTRLPHSSGWSGFRQYDRVDVASAVKEYYQRLIEENQSKLESVDSELYRSRIARYTTRLNKATACETVWRREDGREGNV